MTAGFTPRSPAVTALSSPDSGVTLFDLPDPAATEALGAALGRRLQPGDALLLYGVLGAGKTTLARGAVSAWTGAAEETPSPTYTLVQTYAGPKGMLWHADLYRLEHPDEVAELGLEEAFAEAAVIVEWPERLAARPPRGLDIRLSPRGEGREAALAAFGGAESLIEGLGA
jgi:tRNA threonylcarbamoyladenosine biosynthesis protein TsaE